MGNGSLESSFSSYTSWAGSYSCQIIAFSVSSVVNGHDDVRQTPARVARHSWRCHVEHPGHVTAGTWLGHFHTHITHVTTAIQPFTRHCCRCSFDRHQQHSGKRPLATWKGHNLPCKVLARKKGGPWARGCLTVSDGLLAPLVPSDGPPTQHFSRHDGPRDISSKYSHPLISDLEHLARGVHLPPSPFSGFTFLHSSGSYRRERNERLPRWSEDDFAQNNVA